MKANDEVIQKALESDSAQDIYYAVKTQKATKAKMDSNGVMKALTNALKKDDNVNNLGFGFKTAALLDADVKGVFDKVEDVVVQADEVDGKMLQFEGGLSITSTVITGNNSIILSLYCTTNCDQMSKIF